MTYLKSLLTAVVFTAVAVGFAFAMPAIVTTAAQVSTQVETPATPSVLPTHTPTATVPPAEKDKEEGGEGDHPENHGAAVSTAAHCPLKGKAHGELVRSIAHDKDATVADAKAACDAAVAAAAAAEPAKAKGKPDKAERVKTLRPPKPPKPSKETVVGSEDTAGGPGNGKGHGKP